jgi:hypothetical protein
MWWLGADNELSIGTAQESCASLVSDSAWFGVQVFMVCDGVCDVVQNVVRDIRPFKERIPQMHTIRMVRQQNVGLLLTLTRHTHTLTKHTEEITTRTTRLSASMKEERDLCSAGVFNLTSLSSHSRTKAGPHNQNMV